MNEKKKNNGSIAELRVPKLEVTQYLGRTTTLGAATALADRLIEARPDEMSALEERRFGELVGVRGQAYQVLGRPGEVVTPATLAARNDVLSGVSRVTVMVDALTKSRATALATRAVKVQADALSRLDELARQTPAQVWTEVNVLKEKLLTTPALRKQLETLVPAEAVTELLRAHDGLHTALDAQRAAAVPAVDVRALTKRLNERIDQYALAVLATADRADTASMHRADLALKPIASARAASARRRGRRAAEAETDSVPDPVPDVVPEGTDPVPVTTPVVPAPVDDVPG